MDELSRFQRAAAIRLKKTMLTRLPLAILYLTERCNSRCVSCDYWQHGRRDITLETVERLLPSLQALHTDTVVFSGGEPLVHPQWAAIGERMRSIGLKLWLLTAGLALAKHVERVVGLFDNITVSLDGADAATYAAIRGVDAFDHVCAGIRGAASRGAAVGIRVTLQRNNYRQLPAFVTLARELGAREVSFLAVDVANPHAFGRQQNFARNLALDAKDLVQFEQAITQLEQSESAAFAAGFIAESPAKLRRIHQYFGAVLNGAAYPQVRCNAPEFSAVVGSSGQVQPCFFIAGPAAANIAPEGGGLDLRQALNGEAMRSLRESIRAGQRRECTTCVCSMYRSELTAA